LYQTLNVFNSVQASLTARWRNVFHASSKPPTNIRTALPAAPEKRPSELKIVFA
jgi:hypothetical protein